MRPCGTATDACVPRAYAQQQEHGAQQELNNIEPMLNCHSEMPVHRN